MGRICLDTKDLRATAKTFRSVEGDWRGMSRELTHLAMPGVPPATAARIGPQVAGAGRLLERTATTLHDQAADLDRRAKTLEDDRGGFDWRLSIPSIGWRPPGLRDVGKWIVDKYRKYLDIKDLIVNTKKLIKEISKLSRTFKNLVRGALKNIKRWMGKRWDQLARAMKGVRNFVRRLRRNAGKWVWKNLKKVAESVQRFFRRWTKLPLIKWLYKGRRIFRTIGKIFKRFPIIGIGFGILDMVQGWGKDWWKFAAGAFAVVGGALAIAALAVTSPIWATALGIAALVAGVVSVVLSFRKEIAWLAGKVWDGVKWVSGHVWDFAKWSGGKIWDGTKWVGGKFADGGRWVVDRAVDFGGWAGDRASDVKDWAGDRADDVGDWAGDRAEDAKDFVGGLTDRLPKVSIGWP